MYAFFTLLSGVLGFNFSNCSHTHLFIYVRLLLFLLFFCRAFCFLILLLLQVYYFFLNMINRPPGVQTIKWLKVKAFVLDYPCHVITRTRGSMYYMYSLLKRVCTCVSFLYKPLIGRTLLTHIRLLATYIR